jgi:hypothetical protein
MEKIMLLVALAGVQAKGDHFGILGLRRSASKRDIRLQYRALALEVHPDKNRQSGATDAFHILNDAFREVSLRVANISIAVSTTLMVLVHGLLALPFLARFRSAWT